MCVTNIGDNNRGCGDDRNTNYNTNNSNPSRRSILATSTGGGGEHHVNNNNNNNGDEVFDDEWEEWDGKSPFWHHCVAGSLAGVAEHTLVYPLDTVRTHIQVCAACNYNGQNSLSPLTKAATASSSGSNTSILQKAAASTVSASTRTAGRVVATTNTAATAANAAAAVTASSHSGSTAVHNMSMLQALRQLVAPQPSLAAAAVEGGVTTTATSATSTKAAAPAAAESVVVAAANNGGISRLWRGVHTILVGCIPAHALYFSSYEIIKAATLDEKGNVTTYGSALAGAAATVSHDVVLGPLDTVKQRLQLGHYNGLSHAVRMMVQNEGVVSLFRSFPVTLATNIPYGVVMVGTNEFLKKQWTNDGADKLTLPIMLGASSMAGFMASATTTPLDRIKTYLQTQQLTPACLLSPVSGQAPDVCPLTGQNSSSGNKAARGKMSSTSATASASAHKPLVADFRQAAIRIYQTEGLQGFFRGLSPRVLSHTPAVAISWTTYETAKKYLAEHFGSH
mmetsp:Transcript_39210/g.94788  ORF Transcript_39210/g.94788 Transcript_39210/m.94788 type:complete len:509 (+) Transcript_39210:196-1722(+)